MAPVASITTKQAPNWRVATMRTSIIGLRRLISHGIISTKASAQTTAVRDDEARAEPVVLEAAVEHDLERAEEGRDQHEADEIEPAALPSLPPALRDRGLGLAQDAARSARS